MPRTKQIHPRNLRGKDLHETDIRFTGNPTVKYFLGNRNGSLLNVDPGPQWARGGLRFPCSLPVFCTIPISQKMFHKYLLNEWIAFDKIIVPSQPLVWVWKWEIYFLLTETAFAWRNLKWVARCSLPIWFFNPSPILLLRFISVRLHMLDYQEVKRVVVDINSGHYLQNSGATWPVFHKEAISQNYACYVHFMQRWKMRVAPLQWREILILGE